MDFYERVAGNFQQYIEHTSLSVDAIADIVGTAAERAVQAILTEKKILVIASGLDAATGISLVELLRRDLYRERPAFPAVEIIARHAEPASAGIAWASQQLQALGQPGDLAFVVATTLEDAAIAEVAEAAAQRQVDTIWLGSQGPGLSLVYPGAPESARLVLNQGAVLCLAELIDIMTFGE